MVATMTKEMTEIHAIDHADYLAAMRSMDEAREHLDTLEKAVSKCYYALEHQLEELRRQLKSSRAEIGRAKTTIHSAYHKRREPETKP